MTAIHHHSGNLRTSRERLAELAVGGVMLLTLGAIVVPQLAPAREVDPACEVVESELSRLRAAIERWREDDAGRVYPDLGVSGWTPLIERGLIASAPVNPLNGSSEVVYTPRAGAGWHYEPVTGALGACYFDEGSRALTPGRP